MTTMARVQFVNKYIGDLRSQTGYYIGYIPNVYADQATADNFYNIIENDDEIVRCSHALALMSSGQRIKIKTKNELITKIIIEMINEIGDFLHARKSLLEKGMVYGLGIQKKNYTKVRFPELTAGLIWNCPTSLQEVDRRRLRIERDEQDKNIQYWTIWHPQYDQHIILEDLAENPFAPYSLQDYIWYIHSYEELSPYFKGFGDTLYMLCYIKRKVLQYWADLCESWAKPFVTILTDTVKAGYDAVMGGGFLSQAAKIDKIISEFEKVRAKHIYVGDKSDELKIHENGSIGSNILENLITYCDKKIQLLFFGTELATGTGGSSGGSYALGSVRKQVTDCIVLYNRLRLAETIRLDLIYDFLVRNKKNLDSLATPLPRKGTIQVEIISDSEEEEKKQQQGNKEYGNRSVQK